MDKKIYYLLACPLCKGDLIKKSKILYCSSCEKEYEIIFRENIEIPNLMVNDHEYLLHENPLDKSSIVNFIGGDNSKSFDINLEKEKISIDLGCGNSPRGVVNVDCFIPKKIPRNFILANTEYLPFKKNSFDIAISCYNIEHLTNPSQHILDVLGIIKEEYIIITDNSEWFGDIFFRLIGSGRIYHKEHCYKWSKEYFENLLNRLKVINFDVKLKNYSTSKLVRLTKILNFIPKMKYFFNRDLYISIKK